MGNSNSIEGSNRQNHEKNGQPTSPKQSNYEFQMLSPSQRAKTFDERIHLRRTSISLGQHRHSDFKLLQRAATFDTRLHQNTGFVKVQDVLHRRYFNAKEARGDALDRIPEIGNDANAIVIVDPISTGFVLAKEILRRDYECICLYSDTLLVMKDLIAHIPTDIRDQFAAEIFHNGSDTSMKGLDETIAQLKKVGLNILQVIAGAETGVCLADRISDRMGLTTNGAQGTEARRNKYAMGEKIRSSGLRAVKQCSATRWSQVSDFITKDLKPEPFKVIVKPVESAGSDDVTLCNSMDDVKKAFGNIQGKINHFGLINNSTLIQEYLSGTEYVVDTVSRNGKHKVIAVWEYDKRQMNGAPFVYYGVLLRAAEGDVILPIIDYIFKVLDALHIVHGPAHAEVKFVNGEPCLVEIGSRCHGGEGTYIPIVDRCIGYNHVNTALDSYLDLDAFNALPRMPSVLKAHGCEAVLVSYEHGTFDNMIGLSEILEMSSYVSHSTHLHKGDQITPTIDMFTTPGSILMVNSNSEQLKADYERIREMEHSGLYCIMPNATPNESSIDLRIIVVVDPFSTGAVVAQQLKARKNVKCICVYSNLLQNMEHVASLVPEGVTLEFEATIEHDNNISHTIAAIKKASRATVSKLYPQLAAGSKECFIKAILPGAETGVLLADALAEEMGFDGNVFEYSLARRNKYLMGQTLHNANIRAVLQCQASTWEEAHAFITEKLSMEPFQVVLKPLESAGTEDVTLCLSMKEAKETFHHIFGKINGLGIKNTSVLVQEYLEGDEYVIDTVSRRGVHKVTAIWKYDKRRVNNAAFVYFGLSIIPAANKMIHDLIDYQFQVLDALGFKEGPGHGEVKFCRGSPVLIEVGARCHGGEGAWVPIANTCVGYNQVDVTIDAYLDAGVFDAIPERPLTLPQYGCEVMLVSFENGILKSLPGLKEIVEMESFLKKEIFVGPGDRLRQTIDMFTTPGSIMLTHKDAAVVERDRNRIRELEINGLFELE